MQGRPGRSACRPESDASKITKAGLFMLPALVLAHAPAAGARAQVIYVVGCWAAGRAFLPDARGRCAR